MIKNKFAMAVVVAAGALAVPAAASAATAVPALPAGATQAFASLSSGGSPITAPTTRTFTGSVTLTAAGGTTVTCTVKASITVNVDGTTLVSGITFSPTPCPTSIPGCFATAATSPAPNNTWGNRLISWPGASGAPSGRYDIVNISFQNTFSGTCGPIPTGVPLTETGVVWFRIAPVGGGQITTATPTAPNNVVTNPGLGAATVSGPLTIDAGQPALFVL